MGDATAVDLADEVVDVVLLPGTHLPERLHDPLHAEIVFDTARALERVPELLGIGPHLLATARRPPDSP